MGPKKQSPEDKEKQFLSFKESEEYKQYYAVIDAKEADREIKDMDSGTTDISQDWQKFLNELFKLMEIAKIPHKAKCKCPTSLMFEFQPTTKRFTEPCFSGNYRTPLPM